MLKGSCRVKCGDEILQLCAGDLGVINSNELHKGEGGICDYICIIISPSFFSHCSSIFQKKIRDDHISRLIERIYECHSQGSDADLFEMQGNICYIFSYLVKNYTVRSLGESTYSSYVSKLNKVNESIEFISKNYDRPLSTKALAERAFLSEGYFCRIFKEVTGKTVMQYLNNIRVDIACTMLCRTSMTITDIALYCGFGDANYFSRTYKKIKGVNPQASRQSALREQSDGEPT